MPGTLRRSFSVEPAGRFTSRRVSFPFSRIADTTKEVRRSSFSDQLTNGRQDPVIPGAIALRRRMQQIGEHLPRERAVESPP